MTSIKRALISCTNKDGLVDFAKGLNDLGVQILSTGGTAKLLLDNQIEVTEVSDFTGSPEILDGRVKTLHPKIHGGLLFRRDLETHQQQIKDNNIEPIDLVVVNLYEFEKTVSKNDVTFEQAIENIDIGGPSMLRSAAKNHKDVLVVVDPSDYSLVLEHLKNNSVTNDLKKQMALKVFEKTAAYDAAISKYLKEQINPNEFSDSLSLGFQKTQNLRYGENPHQKACFYQSPGEYGLPQAKQLQGKELSFNNILDLNAAYETCLEFNDPACVIVKHCNPCGLATDTNLCDAFKKARAGDPVSSFGGIVAFNNEVDEDTARCLAETFFECILAPSFSEAALGVLQKKKNLRLLTLNPFKKDQSSFDLRKVKGGLLVQGSDKALKPANQAEVVTNTKPTTEQLASLDFAWRVVKHVKSNAIVFAGKTQSYGIGAGQMSRVDAVKLANQKANESFAGQNILDGAVMASDAFFPFRDGVDEAAKMGIKAIIQPGGSMRDQDVIDACNEHGIAMVFTGMRHFKH